MRLGSFIGAITGPLLSMPLVTGASVPDLSGLVTNSPFGNVEKSAGKAPEQLPQLELRGLIREKDGYLLNIFDLATKKSVWVREGTLTAQYQVRSCDLAEGTALLETAGKTVTLTLKATSRSGEAVGAPGQPAPAVMVAQMRVNASSPAAPPSPAGEVQRLGQVAEQIRLRREQRQKMAHGESKT